jgi:hypothetical protein
MRKDWNTVRTQYGYAWVFLPELAGGGDESAVKRVKLPAVLIPIIIGFAWVIV